MVVYLVLALTYIKIDGNRQAEEHVQYHCLKHRVYSGYCHLMMACLNPTSCVGELPDAK